MSSSAGEPLSDHAPSSREDTALAGSSLRALYSEADEVVPREQQQQQQQQPQTQPQQGLFESATGHRLSPSASSVGMSASGRSSSYAQNPVGSPSSTRLPPFAPSPNNGRASPSLQRVSPQLLRMQQQSDGLGGVRKTPDGGDFFGQTVGPEASTEPAGDFALAFDKRVHGAGLHHSALDASQSASLGRQHFRGTSLQYSGGQDSSFGTPLRAAGIDARSKETPIQRSSVRNLDDEIFFQRDPANSVRRNHTIATGSRPTHGRLDQHFMQVSPNKNSLSAITGGKDAEEDDVEAIFRRRQSILSSTADDEPVEPSSIWSTTQSHTSSHRRYPSQPVSTMATPPSLSPLMPSGTASAHHRSESAHLTGLDHGSFASSPFVPSPLALGGAFSSTSGLLRRHQSLNHHLGRGAARPHATTATSEQKSLFHQPPSPLAASGSSSNDHGQMQTPQAATRSSFMDNLNREVITPHHARQQSASGFDRDTQLAPSLMEAHARLSRMSITPANYNHPTGSMASGAVGPMHSQREDDGLEGRPRLPALVTDRDALAQASHAGSTQGGPATAAPYVPPIGHAYFSQKNALDPDARGDQSLQEGAQSAHPAIGDQSFKESTTRKHRGSRSRGSTRSAQRNNQIASHPEAFPVGFSNEQLQQLHHEQLLLQQQQQRFHLQQLQQLQQVQHAHNLAQMGQPMPYIQTNPPLRFSGMPQAPSSLPQTAHLQWKTVPNQHTPGASSGATATNTMQTSHQLAPPPMPSGQQRRLINSQGISAETRELMAARGLNPPASAFDLNPLKARFFVIKSFTEDDVFRSLKHGVWASTEKGNQRLDRAFKESSAEGPLYLLFSVNGSGHFCGLAQMTTPLDMSADANVWTEEGKWKGSFKVRWIYVKDIPNGALRHIKLTNTTECKPIVQSRDTQELPADGGRAAMKIIVEYPSRTTLLQDWSFYEEQQQQNRPHPGAGQSADAMQDSTVPAPHVAPLTGPQGQDTPAKSEVAARV